MKKAVYNSRGMQIVETGYYEFDRETNCISTGNIFANTQRGSYIRRYSEVICGSNRFPEGELMEYDLRIFTNLPSDIKEILRDKDRVENYILYEFGINKPQRKILGWIVTDSGYNLVCSRVNGYGKKKLDVINEMEKYVCVDGTFEIPKAVKQHFEKLTKIKLCDRFVYEGKEYIPTFYRAEQTEGNGSISYIYKVSPVPRMNVYEITDMDTYENGEGYRAKELLDIVKLKGWTIPQLSLI